MNQNEFLQQLSLGLERLPVAEREDILSDYRAYFNDALADGRSEADVAAALGDPQRLARELMAERKLKIWEANKTPANLGQVLGSVDISFAAALATVLGLNKAKIATWHGYHERFLTLCSPKNVANPKG
jgi:uncharacterized membrane protein